MKISWNWLKNFVDLSATTPEEVAKKLTFAGIEVDGISTLASATNLVIGEILTCEPHPDSDHLHVLNVDEGKKYGVHQIVCGAPNARKGLKVIVARVGAVLPEVTIAPSVIRGVESDGMCCALRELGVDKNTLSEAQNNGIEELPDDAPVGEENVLKYLGLDDSIIEVELLANRPDMYAMENIAREVACLLSQKEEIKDYHETKTGVSSFKVGSNTDKCKIFGAREIRSVSTKESPKWLKDILSSEGIRSINNIVDIGNFVMLLTGCPINMYDADKLLGDSLIVKDDFEGEFLAMNGQSYKIQPGDLVVSSENKPMCLAGIMTSEEDKVTPETKNVIIEVANFNGASIRKTSNRLGLSSDSSSRFVKGLNTEQTERVLRICSSLMKDLADAKEILSIETYDVIEHKEKEISTSLEYINGRLGTSFSLETILETLKRDHFEITKESGNSFTVKVPFYRIDVSGEADISEEVIRLLGFENINAKLPNVTTAKGGYTPKQANKNAIRRFLRNNGLTECVTYSLVSLEKKDSFELISKGETYKLMNPLTEDRMYLRKNILPSLLDVASYNFAHQEKNLALYEISDIDTPTTKGKHLAIVLVGEEHLRGSLEKRPVDFFDIKGYFEGITNLLGINSNRLRLEAYKSDKEELHPGRSASVYLGKQIVASFGELHPEALKKLGFGKNNVAVLEMDLEALLELKTSAEKASIPPRFPSISRDLAFLLKGDVAYSDIKREISRLDKTIKNVEIFDLYEGDKIEKGKKSMAITITFLDENKTLKDEEVNIIMKKVTDMLAMRFNAEVRS